MPSRWDIVQSRYVERASNLPEALSDVKKLWRADGTEYCQVVGKPHCQMVMTIKSSDSPRALSAEWDGPPLIPGIWQTRAMAIPL